MPERKKPFKTNTFANNRIKDLIDQRDSLLIMSKDPKYTPRTRELCLIVADQIQDVIAFQLLPRPRKQYLRRRQLVPDMGTWNRHEEEELRR